MIQECSDHVEHLIGEKPIEILYTKINNYYMPHCLDESIQKHSPWELFRLQGENKMWYTGAFTCQDLTQSIINYNHKLLDKYDFDNISGEIEQNFKATEE